MMAKYRLNDSFKRFSGHYLYVIALVSTGLFFGRVNVSTVKAATPEDSTPTTDATEATDRAASSTVLRTISTVPENSTAQQMAGIKKSAVVAIADSPTAEDSQEVNGAAPVTGSNEPSDYSATETANQSGSSTNTSTASFTLTPVEETIPTTDNTTTPPDTGNSNNTSATEIPVSTAETPTTITADPQNATVIAPDALGVKPVSNIKLNVPVPIDGKDAIKATNAYYYTIDGDINIYNQMANYHGSLKDASDGAWQGSDYAGKISTTADGIDPATKQYYIDEWMPDIWFQYLLWTSKYSIQYQSWATFKNTFSKSSLSNLTDFTVTTSSQQTSSTNLAPTPIYNALVQSQSLEGLQYAQNLNTINFTVNSNVSRYVYGGDIQSHLWDISALGKIPSLRSVRFIDTSVQDISALRDNSLLNNLELSFNQISDISGFAAPWTHVNSPGNPLGSARYSSISMPLLVLKPGTTSVEVSYNVKGADGSLSHMIPSDGNDFGNEVWGKFKASTADAVSEDNHTIVFYNLLTPPAGNVGWLSAAHTFYMDGDDGSAFDVWVFIPYIISNDYGTTNVNYENILPDGQQEEVAASTPLSGPVNNAYNISTDPSTIYPLEWLLDKYGSNYLVLNGTGNYSDYVANNGLAEVVPVTGTYTADPQNLTVLFVPARVTVPVYYLDANGKTIANTQQITGEYQAPFTDANLIGLQQAISGYHFSSVRVATGETLSLPTVLSELQTGLYLIYTMDNINVISPETPDVTPPDDNPGDIIPEKVPSKVIYAMKEISLHTTANFTNDNVIMTYVKKPRIYRPRFMVIDTVRDSQNRLRYLVRDINSKSDTYGLIGYITADSEYVRSAYYHIVPTTITVINPKGINGYANTNLTGKLTHYRQGTVLKVTGILKDKTATRFVLANGQIVTASKILVKMGAIPQPKRATKLNALNRYSDLDLTIKLEHFKKVTPKSFTILNWDYSDGYNYHVKSLKRYQIDNGYITAYSQLVKSEY